MRRSTSRRAAAGRGMDRRVLAAVAAVIVLGGVIGVTQISNAGTNGGGQQPAGGGQTNGLEILGNNCDNSNLERHDGFQKGNRCSSTAFGEVSSAANNPSLLITRAPNSVDVGETFRLKVSTRNLVRDRFLGAAAGGYYLESSFLNADGIQRGHFHVACRMLESTRSAPAPEPVPAFFRAVEDGRGGAEPDTVVVEVTGMPAAGTAQCTVWAGDGSHRAPMMERANQTPAFDSVRIQVRQDEQKPPQDGGDDAPPPGDGGDDAPPPGEDENDQPPADDQGQPPADDNPPADDPSLPPVEDNLPPVDDEQPPAEDKRPPAEQKKPPAEQKKPPAEQKKPPADKDNDQPPASDNDDKPTEDEGTQSPAPGQNAQPDNDPIERDSVAEDTTDLEDTRTVAQDNNPLAETGDRTLPLFGIGGVMLIIGLMILLSTRRHRPRPRPRPGRR